MSTNISRRNFIAGTTGVAAMTALAACTPSAPVAEADTPAPEGLPALEDYPLDPDGADVEALWTSEKLRKDGWFKVTNPDGALIGVMDEAKIIQVAGLAFRDMNGNGKLDAWEDWRQDVDFRSSALAASLTAEDCYPLLWAGGTQGGSISTQLSTDASVFDLVEAGSRAGVSRLRANLDNYATSVEWINQVQEVCEKSALGIPYLNYSDPYQLYNVPPTRGLAAAMDKDLWRQAGMWQARAWRATGVRMELGPQVDVYSNPTGTRLNDAPSEDPALCRDFAAAFGGGMQSTWGDDAATDDLGWGAESCAIMLKHYAGEGSNEGGRDDHSDMGKWNVFPGSNFNAHLVPFLDGGMKLDSKTEQMAAVMPCYGIAYDPNDPEALGETVGSAYSTHNISILRNAGWDGMICTDWMILDHIAHGVKDLTEEERFAKMMENTISQHGGSFQTEYCEGAYKLMCDKLGEDAALQVLQDNCRRIFKAMVTVDLFDQPYSDRDVARAILENETAAAFGNDAADKCIVMLKNDGTLSADGITGKVYIPQRFDAESATIALPFSEEAAAAFDFVTDTVGEASGEADEEGNRAFVEADITRLTPEELADVTCALVYVKSPIDAYQGVEGGTSFRDLIRGNPTGEKEAYYRPMSLQYRPYTADAAYIREESLNPEDEFGTYENRTVKGHDTYTINENDLDLVLDVRNRIPESAKLVLMVNNDRPMIFSELESACDAILMGFESGHGDLYTDAFTHILSGTVEPSGLLPCQMPKDMQTVMEQYEDVPRDMECYVDSMGNTYDFCFGLNWSGVINDERVATYSAPAVTEPELEVVASA